MAVSHFRTYKAMMRIVNELLRVNICMYAYSTQLIGVLMELHNRSVITQILCNSY